MLHQKCHQYPQCHLPIEFDDDDVSFCDAYDDVHCVLVAQMSAGTQLMVYRLDVHWYYRHSNVQQHICHWHVVSLMLIMCWADQEQTHTDLVTPGAPVQDIDIYTHI
jgi:hypothetical protein